MHTSRVPFQIPKSIVEGLSRLSHQEGCTVFMILMAAFNVLLFGYTKQEDIRVATLVANRRHQQIEDLIGLFVNLVVLRTNLSGNPTLREMLRRIRMTTLAAYAYQELPFEVLARTLHREHHHDRQSLFQFMFTMLDARRPLLQAPSLRSTIMEPPTVAVSTCDLAVTIRESAEGLTGICIYKTELFDDETTIRMLGDFQQVLEYFVTQPEKQLSVLSSLPTVIGF